MHYPRNNAVLHTPHQLQAHAKLKTKSKSYNSTIGFLSCAIVTIDKTTVRNAAVAPINHHTSISAARVTQQEPGVWVQGVHCPLSTVWSPRWTYKHSHSPPPPVHAAMLAHAGLLVTHLNQSFKRRLCKGFRRFHNHGPSPG